MVKYNHNFLLKSAEYKTFIYSELLNHCICLTISGQETGMPEEIHQCYLIIVRLGISATGKEKAESIIDPDIDIAKTCVKRERIRWLVHHRSSLRDRKMRQIELQQYISE